MVLFLRSRIVFRGAGPWAVVRDIALHGDATVGASDIDLEITSRTAAGRALPAQRHLAGFELRQIEELLSLD